MVRRTTRSALFPSTTPSRSSGMELSMSASMSGSDASLQNYETTFHKGHNRHAQLLPSTPTVIRAPGSTKLERGGSKYCMYPVGGSPGTNLGYGRAPLTVGQV